MPHGRVVVVGAGIGGLACAIQLAARGLEVQVVERARRAGGKMREQRIGSVSIDVGPTVFTMRWVFDDLFETAGASLDRAITLTQLDILARHAWSRHERLDLFADVRRTSDAIAAFAGPDDARRFLGFCAESKAIYETLRQPFLESPRPSVFGLARRIGFTRLDSLFGIRPFATLWKALSNHFHDPRLRQLFGRYATYSGSSPFLAPATLMLIAHVERDGVWTIAGGMQRLADAMEQLARSLGVVFRFGEPATEIAIERGAVSGVVVGAHERIEADAVVFNGDPTALAMGGAGHLVARAGRALPRIERSLSAMTWALQAEPQGFPLVRHNVFFSRDYAAEFDDLFRRARIPAEPTVYLCAQDRGDDATVPVGPERLFLLVNAPATGDANSFTAEDIDRCEARVLGLLAGSGLTLTGRSPQTATATPADFHSRFPGTGGALYGMASHGPMSAFRRPGSRTRIPGLYVTGGSTHPGAGVPMAALSGRLAAEHLLSDRASMRWFRGAAISGGISTA